MKLPTKKTTPSDDPMQYSILLYGQTKAGKSTFASRAEDAFFIETEPGLNALSVYKARVESWDDILSVCAELSKQQHEFKTIVCDTVDNAYEFCLAHVCKKLKIDHPADLDYGKGWSAVNLEFKRVLTKLAAMPQGLILISHSKVQEVKHKTGKYDKTVPTTGGSKVVLGLMDLVLMVEVESVQSEDGIRHRRVIHTKPTATYDAGDRTARLPATLPLDYHAFIDAFNNPPVVASREEVQQAVSEILSNPNTPQPPSKPKKGKK
jgi:hypothetical protein